MHVSNKENCVNCILQLPPEYPFKPPHIMFLTPSGRFETNTKVCLSFSAYHPELWQPAWGVRLILEALISFLPTPADGAIGALDWSSNERKRLAIHSQSYCCNLCGKCVDLLPKVDPDKKMKSSSPKFSKEIEELQRLQQMAEGTTKQDENETSGGETRTKTTNHTQPKSASPNEIISNHETEEEEIVFQSITSADAGIPSPPSSPSPIDAVGQPAAQNDPQIQEPQQQPLAEHDGVMAYVPEEQDPSWMYDSLLNLTIVLFAAICYMLWQKFEALKEELAELRAENLLLEG